MTHYTQRVRESILPLSVGGSLPRAFEEWYFTEMVVDHETPIETCQLCGQEDLRYHFQIQNEFTDHTQWVGSQCILKFDVAVFEDGRRLTESEAKKKLSKLTENMRLEACLKALETVAEVENSDVLRNALTIIGRTRSLRQNSPSWFSGD
jgi:hypothetical protein